MCYAPTRSKIVMREKEKRMRYDGMPEPPVLHHFKMIHDYVEKQGNAYLKEVGLTLAQGHMLGFLKHSPDYRAPLKELEQHMKVAQSTTAGMAARLEQNGFVRIIADLHDKRIKVVELTDKGLESIKFVKGSMRKIDDALFSDLTEEELEILKVLLKKVTSNCRN